jgi:cell wall-associated NlpC family hydrolase
MIPVASPSAASGDPLDDKRAEAARIQDDLEAQGRRVSVAAQQFNRTQGHLQEVRGSLAKAQEDLKRADERMVSIKGQLAQVAVNAYVHGGSNAVLSRLARSGGHANLIARSQYLRVAAKDQRRIIGELRSAREDFTALKGRLAAEEKEARAAADDAEEARREAAAAESAQRAILGRVQGELADLVAAEEARRLAAEAARAPRLPDVPVVVFDDVPATRTAPAPAAPPTPAPAATAPAATGSGVQVASKPAAAVPVSSKAAIAVRTAEEQVGKPYVYGGSGPDSFDCSGLTSYAWRAAGVSLSHDAYAQYFETTRVPIDEVQPGDLLFFGKDGVESIHHNAIYVGNGQMVEASQTGVPVRYRGWRAADLVGAGRPG